MQVERQNTFTETGMSNSEDCRGFTLIELLVVVIIIGILTSVALPAFLSQANKARQSEAKTYIGSLNKGQQVYYVQRSAFTTTVVDLGVGIKTQTSNYTYETTPAGAGTNVTALSQSHLIHAASSLKTYSGLVSLQVSGARSDVTSVAILCQEKQPGTPATQPTDGQTCNAKQIQL